MPYWVIRFLCCLTMSRSCKTVSAQPKLLATVMDFSYSKTSEVRALLLEPRSVLEPRGSWQHAITQAPTLLYRGKLHALSRQTSLTFRTNRNWSVVAALTEKSMLHVHTHILVVARREIYAGAQRNVPPFFIPVCREPWLGLFGTPAGQQRSPRPTLLRREVKRRQ